MINVNNNNFLLRTTGTLKALVVEAFRLPAQPDTVWAN